MSRLTFRNGRDVPCPRCGVGAGETCRTDKTNRTTDTHQARFAQSSRVALRRKIEETNAARKQTPR